MTFVLDWIDRHRPPSGRVVLDSWRLPALRAPADDAPSPETLRDSAQRVANRYGRPMVASDFWRTSKIAQFGREPSACIDAAASVRLMGYSPAQIAYRFGLPDSETDRRNRDVVLQRPRTAQRLVQRGDKLLSRLGAWPWAAIDEAPPLVWPWWDDDAVQSAFADWYAQGVRRTHEDAGRLTSWLAEHSWLARP